MKVKNLKQEIKSILASIGNNFGKDTREYQDAEYYFDILQTVSSITTTMEKICSMN